MATALNQVFGVFLSGEVVEHVLCRPAGMDFFKAGFCSVLAGRIICKIFAFFWVAVDVEKLV